MLKNRFNGHFKNVVAKCNRNALKLMEVVVDNFESYRDEASYKGKNGKPPSTPLAPLSSSSYSSSSSF